MTTILMGLILILVTFHCTRLEKKLKKKDDALHTMRDAIHSLLEIVQKTHPEAYDKVALIMDAASRELELKKKEMRDL